MTGHSPWLPRIVAWHARLSLARKLTFLGVLTSVMSLVIAMTAVLAWDLSSARTRLVRDTGMLADVIGSNSQAAVAFGDGKAATDTLRALTVNDSIVSAAVWTMDGKELARFDRASRPKVKRTLPARAFEVAPHQQWSEFTDGALLLARPIVLDGDVILPADGNTISERRRMAVNGLIIVAVPVSPDGKLAGPPLVRPFGVPVEVDRDDFLADATDAATRAYDPASEEDRAREAVRLAVRRCATLWTGKKPVVEVMLLQVAQ